MWRDDVGNWTQQDELAAAQVEATDLWGRITSQALGIKARELPKPPRIEHPDRRAAAPERPKIMTTDPREISAWFSKHMRS